MNAVLNDGAMRAGFAALKEGVTELEVGQAIRDFYAANGATTQFISICFGENGAFPHHHTGDRKLKANEAVLIDIGGRKDGYPSDMTRVGVFGETPEGFDEIHGVAGARGPGGASPPPGRASPPRRSTRPRATSSPPPAMAISSCTAPATASASTSTSRPTSPARRKRSCRKATSSRSSRASTCRAASASGWKRSSSCAAAAPRCFRTCRAMRSA